MISQARAPYLRHAPESGEVVALSERMSHLQLLRVLIVLIALLGTWVGLEMPATVRAELGAVSGAYLVGCGLTELVRRRSTRGSVATLAGMLLVDGIYLAWMTYSTGGMQSPLRFLLFVHLIAVALLASYRSALKIAVWHSLLSIAVLYGQWAHVFAPREAMPGAVPTSGDWLGALPVFNVTAFLVVAVVTASFSALNERELRRRRADSETLATMATEMERLADPDEIAQRLLAWLGEDFGFGRGVVLVSRDGLSVLAHRGTEPVPAGVDRLDPIVEEAWARREPALLRGIAEDANPALARMMPGARRVLVFPLFAEGQLLGTVALEHAGGRGWRIERRLVAVAAQLVAYGALALGNAWLLEQVRQMAATDGLTGVGNRRTFDQALARELARARREQAAVSLALLDVDHFKAYNDRHGHLAGDEVLQALARALEAESRGHDVVARYGGEEFALILPGCPQPESVAIAERLCAAARALPLEVPVTVSVGVATFPADAAEADSLIAAADEALYRSKQNGRDRASAAGEAVGAAGDE